eukprot:COSAG06_NODE_10592_length_1652_cov_1.389569_3_plen_104_part_01
MHGHTGDSKKCRGAAARPWQNNPQSEGTHEGTKPASCSRAAIAKTLLALAFLGLIAGAATLGVTGIGPWPGLTIHKKAPSTQKLASVGELDLHATLNNTAAPDP